MSLLITADIHQTDNPRDEHRWGLFPWLAAQANKYRADAVMFLGDLTEAKDKHSAVLVERLVDGMGEVSGSDAEVIIIKGNHDYFDPAHPFFGFLRRMKGIRFYSEPVVRKFGVFQSAAIPSTANFAEDWKDVGGSGLKFLFTHQTFDGAKAENNRKLPGISPSLFDDYPIQVISGDIHTPQKVGKKIEYAGSPYRIDFGDSFKPRVMLVDDDGGRHDLHFPCKSKELIELDGLGGDQRDLVRAAKSGDQVKIRVRLRRADIAEWPETRERLKKLSEKNGWELRAIEPVYVQERDDREQPTLAEGNDPAQQLVDFSRRKRIGRELEEFGRDLLREVL